MNTGVHAACVQCRVSVRLTAHGLNTTMASIKQLPSGKYRALIRKAGLAPISKTFPSEKLAKAWAYAEEKKLDAIKISGRAAPPSGSTLADFVMKYIEEVGAKKSFGKTKMANLKRIASAFRNVTMANLNEAIINRYVEVRLKDKNHKGEAIGGVTIAGDLSEISAVLGWAKHAKKYDVDDTIAKSARAALKYRGLNTRSVERDREPTKEELEKIFEAYDKSAEKRTIPMPDMIRFAISSAMRQEEICSIRIEDIDRDAKTVIIRNRKHPTKKEGNHQVVPLLGDAWDLAMNYAGDRTVGRVFNYNHKSVSASFTRVCKRCKIEDLHFHDLRHAAIGILFELGLQIQQVAVISGHSDWKMLKRYTHIKAEDVHAAFNNGKARRLKREAVMDFLDEAASN